MRQSLTTLCVSITVTHQGSFEGAVLVLFYVEVFCPYPSGLLIGLI